MRAALEAERQGLRRISLAVMPDRWRFILGTDARYGRNTPCTAKAGGTRSAPARGIGVHPCGSVVPVSWLGHTECGKTPCT
jgi:hypothetical protein